ncbi:MAG: MBL fold metallo-hydrolase [Pseudomonadota bacterium]
MPLIPNQNEQDAARCAREFKDFIKVIKNLDQKTSASTITKVKANFQLLETKAKSILAIIKTDAERNKLSEINNYYFRYFLEQVSRYNQYFNEIANINDQRNPDTTHPVLAFAAKDILANAAITPIKDDLLVQSEPVKMTVTVKSKDKGDIFKPHFEIMEKGTKHHYYRAKTTPDDQLHQDLPHYMEANKQIFLATQGENVLSLIKGDWNHGSDAYFQVADRERHGIEKALFETALTNIKEGQSLSDEQLTVLEKGKYYRYPIPIRFMVKPPAEEKEEKASAEKPDHKITHVGHAAEILTMNSTVPLTLSIDPVHYQSGTGGLIAPAAKLFYDRHTAPAMTTDSYPKMNVVIISHNHHDHMCPCSLQEGFAHSNTLFIVPKGDAKHMKSSAFALKNANVVEFNSWDDSAEIELTNAEGVSSKYEVRALPANHASNRGPTDFYESLYMGYMVRDLSKNQVVLFTGDTAVLSDQHFEQLEKYLVDNNLFLQSACIAHGPDRPRKWMECTHQSTADAIAMHARFNMMNAAVYAKQQNKKVEDLTFQELKNVACHGIGYHQGCYRLGVLTNQDVNTTILRMLATLKSVADVAIKDINAEFLKDNIFYHFMDEFERIGVLDTIKSYQKLSGTLNAGQVARLVTSHLTVPVPGAGVDFQAKTPHPGFTFNYESLMQNRDPNVKTFDPNVAAYDYFAAHLFPKYFMPKVKTRELIELGLNIYLQRPRKTYAASKAPQVQAFLASLPQIAEANLVAELGKFYSSIFPPQDNGIRDEGHLHTMITLLGGLIQFPEFRKQFQDRHNELRGIKSTSVAKHSKFADKSSTTLLAGQVEVREHKHQPRS